MAFSYAGYSKVYSMRFGFMVADPITFLLEDARELRALGMEQEALQIFRDISTEHPHCIESYIEQVDIILNRGIISRQELLGAEQLIDQALLINKFHPDGNYYKGYILSLLNRWEDALPYLVTARELDADDSDTLRVFGWIHFHLQDKALGIKLLKQAIGQDKHCIEAYENLAECYLALQMLSVAQEVLEQGLLIDPTNEVLLELLWVAKQEESSK